MRSDGGNMSLHYFHSYAVLDRILQSCSLTLSLQHVFLSQNCNALFLVFFNFYSSFIFYFMCVLPFQLSLYTVNVHHHCPIYAAQVG